MKKILIVLLGIVITNVAYAQNQNNIWYFGYKAGLDFNYSPPKSIANPPTPIIDSDPFGYSYSGKLGILSDRFGHLVSFWEGIRAYNGQNALMENGNLREGYGSFFLSLIIPSPASDSQAYLFKVANGSLSYYIADITASNGKGAIISGKNMLLYGAGEKLTATQHCNGKDFWVVTTKGTQIYAYLLTSNGTCTAPIISSTTQIYSLFGGDLKFSSDGKMLVSVGRSQDTEIFTFDTNNGQASSLVRIPKDMYGNYYSGYATDYNSASFSPDNSKLYATSGNWRALDGRCAKVVQYDLKATDIPKSGYILYDNTVDSDAKFIGGRCRTMGVGDVQLGPDGKLYISNPGRDSLHVIENPNAIGADARFLINGVSLGKGAGYWRLPNLIESFYNHNPSTQTNSCPGPIGKIDFTYRNTCYDQDTNFDIQWNNNGPFSVLWQFGDKSSWQSDTSNIVNPAHRFTKPGTYKVRLILTSLYNCSITDTISKSITIVPKTALELGHDTTLCVGEQTTFTASVNGAKSYLWSDGSTDSVLVVKQPGKYWVKVDLDGCILSDSVIVSKRSPSECIPACQTITKESLPTLFTPNGDGFNDFFGLEESDALKDFQMEVYNRWGRKVFATNQNIKQWDGSGADNGVYYYLLTFICIENKKETKSYVRGTITILR